MIKKFNEMNDISYHSYTGRQISGIMRALWTIGNNGYDDSAFIINDKYIGKYPILSDLLGYKIEIDVDGDHRHDGQMVDYTFTFISPEGKRTRLRTEMCLVVGFNYWENAIIK